MLGRWPVLLHDALAVPTAWLGAYWFRFNLDQIPDIFLDQAIAMLPIVLVWHLAFFVMFGVHRGAWRFTSTHDLSVILKSVLVGTGRRRCDSLYHHRLGGGTAFGFPASWTVSDRTSNWHENCLPAISG